MFINIKLSATFHQNIPNGFKKLSFTFFQNLNLGNTITISWATSCQNQCVCKISSQYFSQFKRQSYFHFFRSWSSAKPRLTKTGISQSPGLDLVNLNVFSEVFQNIPLSSRDKTIFTFSRIWRSAKPRPMINVILQ